MLKRTHLIFTMLFVVTIVAGYLLADYQVGLPKDAVARYVGRDSCASCHQQQVELFVGSHHDMAMDYASPDSVLANFDDQTLEHFGVTSRMFRDGDRYMIHTEGPDGSMRDFEIKYTFGVEPLQQYMVELEGGRVQVLRVSWDTTVGKWFYLSPPDVDEKLDPSDPLHWTGITQNWNVSCAECHSTNLQKNFDIASATWDTSWSEIDVSCEACHGPASLHNEIASQVSPFWDKHHGTGLVKLKTESNLEQVQACAPCHSRRTVLATGYQPGCNYDDFHSLQLLTEPIYHADGQIRDEDYVHGSFTQSKMFHNGIKCSDCHDPHSLKLKYSGNMVCTSCHQHPAGKYDSESHHHHKPGTAGAMCVNCHMPSTTYMAVDARRDHSFRVPRPDLSLTLGTPNACTQCHFELEPGDALPQRSEFTQYLDWVSAAGNGDTDVAAALNRMDDAMAKACLKWYPPETSPPKTMWYAELAEAQSKIRNNESAVDLLHRIATDSANPAIIRATSVQLLATQSDPLAVDTAIERLSDADTKVVVAAISTVESNLIEAQNQQLYSDSPNIADSAAMNLAEAVAQQLLHDSPRVRMEAARALTSVSPQIRSSILAGDTQRRFETELNQYRESLMVMSDTAGAHMQLGSIAERMGQSNQAAESYRNAIRLQPNLHGPRSSLAMLLENKIQTLQVQFQEANEPSEALSNQIVRLAEDVAMLRKKDHELLGIDVDRAKDLPGVHVLHYRFGMSSYLQRDLANAEKHLRIAAELAPENEGYLMGLATFYLQRKDVQKASPLIDRLLRMAPNNNSYRALKRQRDSMQ